MPWKHTSVSDEQVRFITAWQQGAVSFAALCRQFGISRKTGYKRLHRFRDCGWDGLGDRSRAPHHHPRQVPSAIVAALLAAKRAHPTWGPRKLIPWLRAQDPHTPWPAPSTAGRLLARAGLVRQRRRTRRTVPWDPPFAPAIQPNDVWCMDFKGWFRTSDGQRCHPLTVVDAASRALLVCQALTAPTTAQVRPVLEHAFRTYGLPRAIRTDNGPPFASTGLGGLTPLAVWLVKLGIVPERISPGHPEQNGRLERLHRTLKAETAQPPRATPRAQQRAFDAFRQQYNTERPHEALGYRPPAACYAPSLRPYPRQVPELAYDEAVTVRRVRSNGEIKWQGDRVYVSEALRGERVGLVAEDQRYWSVLLGPLRIGLLDQVDGRVLHTPVEVLPMF